MSNSEQYSQNINPLAELIEGLSDTDAVAVLDDLARKHRMMTFDRLAHLFIEEREQHVAWMRKVTGLPKLRD